MKLQGNQQLQKNARLTAIEGKCIMRECKLSCEGMQMYKGKAKMSQKRNFHHDI